MQIALPPLQHRQTNSSFSKCGQAGGTAHGEQIGCPAFSPLTCKVQVAAPSPLPHLAVCITCTTSSTPQHWEPRSTTHPTSSPLPSSCIHHPPTAWASDLPFLPCTLPAPSHWGRNNWGGREGRGVVEVMAWQEPLGCMVTLQGPHETHGPPAGHLWSIPIKTKKCPKSWPFQVLNLVTLGTAPWGSACYFYSPFLLVKTWTSHLITVSA